MTRRDGRRRARGQRFRSLVDFYNADSRRIDSGEVDVGLWWRDDPEGPLHRAAWVLETGELYLVRLGPPAGGGGGVEVLARAESRERLEEALSGWRDRCGAPGSLAWLRERAAVLGERASVPRRRTGWPAPGPVPA